MNKVLKYLRNRSEWKPLCRLECMMGSATVWVLESSMPAKSHQGVNAVMEGRACDLPNEAHGSESDEDTGTHWDSQRTQKTNCTAALRLASSLPVGRSTLLMAQRLIPSTRPIVATVDPLKIDNESEFIFLPNPLYELMEEPVAVPTSCE